MPVKWLLYSTLIILLLATPVRATDEFVVNCTIAGGVEGRYFEFRLYETPLRTANILTQPSVWADDRGMLSPDGIYLSITYENVPSNGIYSLYFYTQGALVSAINDVDLSTTREVDFGIILMGDAKGVKEKSKAIDAVDFQRAALAYETVEGGEGYNHLCDFDNDKVITIQDVSFIIANYGLTSPRIVGGK